MPACSGKFQAQIGGSSLQDQVALVTGASRGLGYATAELLGAAGIHVIALARTPGALEELDDRIAATGGSATLVPCNIADTQALRQLCRTIYERWRKLDLLIHAAIHAPQLSPAVHGEYKEWERAAKVNLLATVRLASFTAPLLRCAKPGTAVFLEDKLCNQKFSGAYGSTKTAQIAFARNWREESPDSGSPYVVIFSPEPMATKMRARFYPGEDSSVLASPTDEAKRLVNHLRVSKLLPVPN